VGVFAVQLAKWKGAQVIGTASTANLDLVRSLGADIVVDYTTTPVESVVQHVDLVVNGVGGETLNSSLAVLRRGGTLISLAGPPPQEQAMAKGVRATMIHSQPSAELLQRLARLIDEGQLRAVVGKTFLLREAQQAHEYGQRGHGRGRIVLQMADERDDEGHRPAEEREKQATRTEPMVY
jgi:NADPH:quinone reductase-like Zn-dependent oxidoreductase